MKQYEMMELEWTEKAPRDSQVAVDLVAVFTKEEKSITVKGFYAGNDRYKIRFLPMEAGNYEYEVHGVIEASGSIQVDAAEENTHGPVHAEGTHLQFADGTYFCSFGTTVYALAHQTPELTEETFATLADAPFNKVRMCVFPKHYNYNINDPEYFAFETFDGKEYKGVTLKKNDMIGCWTAAEDISDIWDVNRPCFAFWDAFEEKIERLNQMGIQVDLILFHPYDRWGFSKLQQKDNLVYLDYLLRRFSAYPNIWWSLANEYDLCHAKSLEDWKEIEDFIAGNDPYHHMMSNHNCFPMYDFSHEAITHCSIQKRVMNLVSELQRKYQKPVCYDECAYEGNLKEGWGSISGKEMVNRFWKVTTSGGYCTHGEVFLDPQQENIDEAVLWWAKGGSLHGESPKRIAFLRKIMEEIGAPLDPVAAGLSQIFSMSQEQQEQVTPYLPPNIAFTVQAIGRMDRIELIRHTDSEFEYVGATADQSALLWYYGIDCHARVDIMLPEDKTYRVEVLDAWNMTRETVATGVSGKKEIALPGREYMAVLAMEEV